VTISSNRFTSRGSTHCYETDYGVHIEGPVHGSQRPESADVPECPRPRVDRRCVDVSCLPSLSRRVTCSEVDKPQRLHSRSDGQIDRDSDAFSPTARFVATTAKCTETGQNGSQHPPGSCAGDSEQPRRIHRHNQPGLGQSSRVPSAKSAGRRREHARWGLRPARKSVVARRQPAERLITKVKAEANVLGSTNSDSSRRREFRTPCGSRSGIEGQSGCIN
jgi:hypothetical protein